MSMIKIGSDGRALAQPSLAAFLDQKNGLMWAANDGCDKALNYADAEKAVAEFRSAGFSDWRLPTIDELETLRDRSRFNPAADPELGLKSSYYWSSTPFAESPSDFAWFVYFNYGGSSFGSRYATAFVRAVRSARASQ